MRSGMAAVLAILGILILGLAPSFNTTLLPVLSKANATTHYFTLNGSAGTLWNNSNPGPAMTVTESDLVIVSLVSTDNVPHQLDVDVDRDYPQSHCGYSVDKCSDYFGDTYPQSTTYSFEASIPAGNYTYFCTVHQYMIGTFVVKGFNISSSPYSMAVLRGSSATSTIAIGSVNRFSGTASLSSTASGGLGTLLNSTTVSLASGGTSAVSLTINVPATTPVGTYNVEVNATIGSISHAATVAVAVKRPGFSLSPNPAQLVVLQGSSKTTTITVTSLNTFNGTVSLSTSAVAGVTTRFAPPNLTLTTGRSAASTLNVTVASSATSGEYNLTLTGTSNSDTNATRVDLVVGQDFNLTATPLGLTVAQASYANATITLVSLNNFKGSISLSSTNTPTGLSVSFNNTLVNLSRNQTVYVSVRISASQLTTPKMYGLVVIGVNDTRIRSITLNVTVSGFVIQFSPALLSLNQGGAGILTVAFTSVNGFSGLMTLTITGSSALTHSVVPSSAQLVGGTSLNVTLMFSASISGVFTPPGTYAFNMTGNVGSLSHSTTVTVAVTALPPTPKPSGDLPLPLIAGVIVSLAALSSVVGFWMRRENAKGKNSPELKSS